LWRRWRRRGGGRWMELSRELVMTNLVTEDV
jgi:hypothetical protein